ncbi:MAG: TetR family transcriptional regulator [Polyangiaceae bacterium]|nr:TetR family transcriptional regulator [Polyangiaceae bacterium]
MARPTVIRNEAILEAARDVFLERGILGTSAEVAQRAGVSEELDLRTASRRRPSCSARRWASTSRTCCLR